MCGMCEMSSFLEAMPAAEKSDASRTSCIAPPKKHVQMECARYDSVGGIMLCGVVSVASLHRSAREKDLVW